MRYLLLSTLLICASIHPCMAAGTGALKGKVTGPDGKPIANATVILKSRSTESPAQTAKTGTMGTYAFSNLSAGEYNALISAPSYESQRFTSIEPKDKSILLNVQLRKAGAWGSSIESHQYQPQVESEAVVHKTSVGRHTSRSLSLKESSGKSLSGAGATGTRTKRAYSAVRDESYGMAEPSAPPYRRVEEMPIFDGAKGSGKAADIEPISVASTSLSIAANPDAHAGSLTSGEINDFSKWTLWEDLSMEELKGYRSAWPFRPEARYTVIVKAKNGAPLCNARVKMSNSKGAVWEAVTDNTGKAELWYGMYETTGSGSNLTAVVECGAQHFNLSSLKPFASGVNMLNTSLPCLNPAKLDIAFLVDATGSMGDEISYLKAELRDILQKVKDSMPSTEVQTGALFYRDVSDDYLTRVSDLTPDFNKTEAFIADNEAGGGGDTPEGVDAALEEALNSFTWRSDATARLAFLVLDAPPHGDAATVKRMQELTAQYATRGIRLIPVVCSGSDKPTEYLMRAIALATNGTYLFLTDHSGIGGSHTAPTTDKYDVEYLNGLIYRVIHQFAYMPSCKDIPIANNDTTRVQQQTDSATTINWSYYPNPTTGIVHIRHTNTTGHLLVTDITGKAILRIPTNPGGTTDIDLTQYPAGLYAIRYNWEEDRWVTGKFTLIH